MRIMAHRRSRRSGAFGRRRSGAFRRRDAPNSASWLPAIALGSAFVCVALWIAGPALDGDFLSDDFLYIVYNPYVHDLSFEKAMALLDPWGVPSTLTTNYAPVHLFAYAIEWKLFGGEATRGWHVVNAVAHGLTALLLLALFRRSGLPRAAALFGATFFLVQPVNVEAVCWISQLKTLLALALSVGALLLLERRPALAALLFALAVLTKFTAAAILPAAVVQAWVRSRNGAAPAPWRWLAAWAGIVLLISVPEMAAFKRQSVLRSAIEGDALVHARTIVAIAMRYLVIALTARGVSTFHEPEPAVSFLDPWWLAGLGALALLCARMLVTLRRRDEEAVYWVMAAAAFGPVSQVFPFTFPMGDRYLYPILPGLIGGVLLAARPHARRLLVAIAARSEEAAGALRSAAALAAMAVIAVLAAVSERRAPVFTTAGAMMQDASIHYRDGMQAALLRGERAAREGDARAAARAYQRAVDLGYLDLLALLSNPVLFPVRNAPEFQKVVHNVAERMIEYFNHREDLDQIELWHLGIAYEQSGDSVAAIRVLQRALEDAGPFEPQIRRLLDELRRSYPAAAEEARGLD
jgi:hypothetical protein